MNDATNPDHYKKHSISLEPIALTERLGFNLGNCIKYCIRYKDKYGDKEHQIEDLNKALFYVHRLKANGYSAFDEDYDSVTSYLIGLFAVQDKFVNALKADIKQNTRLAFLEKAIEDAIKELKNSSEYKDC